MKTTLNWILLIAFALTSNVSCQWESEEDFVDPCNSTITWTPAPPDTCFVLPINGLGYINATRHWPLVLAQHYCPFDPNRFVYLNVYSMTGDVYMNTANLCTGEIQLITSERTIDYPQWGATDWILFKKGNFSLFKVKSNGDSLMALNALTGLRSYFWMNNGQTIQANWEYTFTEHLNLIFNAAGEIIDTIPISIRLGDYKNQLIAATGYYQNDYYIGIVNPDNWQFTPLVQLDENNPPSSVNWLDDKNIIWSNYDGIHAINIITNQISTLRATPCDNMRYTYVSAAKEDSGMLLTTRIEYIYVKPDSLVEYARISLLDSYTGQEWILGLE
ncbi:MAG: hypothetical protein IPN33_01315 [Saprospiraceae bacterium]|nr:hypothetical protein [Saprospiraceae bacterium]